MLRLNNCIHESSVMIKMYCFISIPHHNLLTHSPHWLICPASSCFCFFFPAIDWQAAGSAQLLWECCRSVCWRAAEGPGSGALTTGQDQRERDEEPGTKTPVSKTTASSSFCLHILWAWNMTLSKYPLIQLLGELKPIPANIWPMARHTLDRSLVFCKANTDRQSFTLTFIRTVSLELPMNLTCISLDCGWEHTNTCRNIFQIMWNFCMGVCVYVEAAGASRWNGAGTAIGPRGCPATGEKYPEPHWYCKLQTGRGTVVINKAW